MLFSSFERKHINETDALVCAALLCEPDSKLSVHEVK